MADYTKKLNLPDEKKRLEIKALANETRSNWANKGFTDIFMILENAAILIRRPIKTNVSGFSTFFNNEFAVFLNSNYTLGHERFSGAHELYHITYDKDLLKNKKLLLDEGNENEERAMIFAAEFLMPDDGVKELFYKLINLKPEEIEPKHIVKMMYAFQVSYAAMLKKMIQMGLCVPDKYQYLREFGGLEKVKELEEIIAKEGFNNYDLIRPSKKISISTEYIEIARSNYEKGKISYGKLNELLEFAGKTPKDFGYINDEENES